MIIIFLFRYGVQHPWLWTRWINLGLYNKQVICRPGDQLLVCQESSIRCSYLVSNYRNILKDILFRVLQYWPDVFNVQ